LFYRLFVSPHIPSFRFRPWFPRKVPRRPSQSRSSVVNSSFVKPLGPPLFLTGVTPSPQHRRIPCVGDSSSPTSSSLRFFYLGTFAFGPLFSTPRPLTVFFLSELPSSPARNDPPIPPLCFYPCQESCSLGRVLDIPDLTFFFRLPAVSHSLFHLSLVAEVFSFSPPRTPPSTELLVFYPAHRPVGGRGGGYLPIRSLSFPSSVFFLSSGVKDSPFVVHPKLSCTFRLASCSGSPSVPCDRR